MDFLALFQIYVAKKFTDRLIVGLRDVLSPYEKTKLCGEYN